MSAVATQERIDAFAQAQRCHEAGEYDSAAQWYGIVLQTDGRHAGALRGLGELCEIAGQTEQAVKLFRSAARADIGDYLPWLRLAELQERAGQVTASTEAYRQAAERRPRDAAIRRALGNVLRTAGLHDAAERELLLALELDPHDVQAVLFLGALQLARSQYDLALASFERVRTVAPSMPEPKFFTGICLQAVGRHGEAVEILEPLVLQHPPRKEWLNALGSSLLVLGRHADALAAHRSAYALDATDADTAVRMARAMALVGEYRPALTVVDEVLARVPDDREALRLRIQLLQVFDLKERALEITEQLLALDPDDPFGQAQRVSIRQRSCIWHGYEAFIADVARYIRGATERRQPMQLTIQDLHNLPLPWELEVAAARRTAEAIETRAAPARARLGFRFEDRLRARTPRKLRIGYTLPYTKEESFTLLHEGVVAHHDHSRFEIYAYACQPSVGTDFDRRYRGHFDVVRDVMIADAESAARQVYADQIDVLLDPAGHTGEHCQELVALRPAPVVAQTWGYSITTGAPYVDYLVTDARFMPPEMGALCSETLVYLPDALLPGYRPAVSDRAFTRAELRLPEQAFVFCDFNQPFKFEPSMFGAWMRVLARVPGSVLWLGSWDVTAQRNLRREAETAGVHADRLVFSDVAGRGEHLARLKCADLVLDTRYHSGGATTLDAFWVGLPMVTLADATPASRNGISFATAIGMPEMVAHSLQAFEDLAVQVASTPALHAAWRAKLARNRLTAPLFDQPRFTRQTEDAVEAMWQQAVEGRRAPITIAPRGGA